MSAAKNIHVLQQHSAPRRISLRELAQTLLYSLAAVFISPLSFASHPIHRHLSNAMLFDAAAAHLSPESCKPLFFSHQPFTALSPTQLDGLLTSLSMPDSAEHQHFALFKDWIAGAYYSSEIGMRELGWTPDRVFANFPACPHPKGHA